MTPHITLRIENSLIPIETTHDALKAFGLRNGHTVSLETAHKLNDYALAGHIAQCAINDAMQSCRVLEGRS